MTGDTGEHGSSELAFRAVLTRDEHARSTRRSPPSARRLLVQFLVFALSFALVVVVAVAGVLLVVRDRAEDDVDAMLQDNIETQLEQSAAQQAETVEVELRSVQADEIEDRAHSLVCLPPKTAAKLLDEKGGTFGGPEK